MTSPPKPSYREIPLTKGYVAIVDAADFEWLSQWKWHTNTSHGIGMPYAYRRKTVGPKRSILVAMHREVLGLVRGDGLHGDHVDPSTTLDNRRANLRIATPAEKWKK